MNFARVSAKIVAALLLAVTVLQRAGFDVLSVVTGLGIGGLAVALAAQETLGNLLGSLQIMTDRPFSIGDYIKVDAHFGRVTDIGLRSTRLLQGNGIRTVIPNKKLAEATIENHSHPDGLVRDFMLSLAYESTPAQVQEAVDLVRAVLAAEARIHPEFSVLFVNFGDSALGVRVLYKVPDANVAGDVAHAVNLAIHAGFLQAGVKTAFPTRTVRVEPVEARRA
jgi:MscS family membrane protein